MVKVLGISASLRNARVASADTLVKDLSSIDNRKNLELYIAKQSQILVDAFIEAGRAENKPFNEIYKNLRRLSGKQGLSNSEGAMACGLWAAQQEGVDIDHLSLARHFPPSGKIIMEEELKNKIMTCNAILLSGPVYFGDRGSLAQSFLNYCSENTEISAHLKGKVYGGIAVGAKRNGGQETTLIYQMLDMVNMDMMAVGNDSTVTSQYGGTVVAGDIGKLTSDEYGITTCIGTGRRVAHVAKLVDSGSKVTAKGKIKVHLWLLQDDDKRKGLAFFKEWCDDIKSMRDDVEFVLWDVLDSTVGRCIACDVCPIEVGESSEYRCIITSKKDFFAKFHEEISDADAILVCAHNPGAGNKVLSEYQEFIERTRYIRRDNYLFSDLLVAPFILSELSARKNLHLRIMTSMVRHDTVISHPLICMNYEGKKLNYNKVIIESQNFIDNAYNLSVGRLKTKIVNTLYKPEGYIISKDKFNEDMKSGLLEETMKSSKNAAQGKLNTRLRIIER